MFHLLPTCHFLQGHSILSVCQKSGFLKGHPCLSQEGGKIDPWSPTYLLVFQSHFSLQVLQPFIAPMVVAIMAVAPLAAAPLAKKSNALLADAHLAVAPLSYYKIFWSKIRSFVSRYVCTSYAVMLWTYLMIFWLIKDNPNATQINVLLLLWCSFVLLFSLRANFQMADTGGTPIILQLWNNIHVTLSSISNSSYAEYRISLEISDTSMLKIHLNQLIAFFWPSLSDPCGNIIEKCLQRDGQW